MAGLSCPARTLLTVPPTLIITNDFPPRIGGIESFVSEICTLLNHDVVVYASGSPGASASDRDRGFPVIRDGPLLLPTPRVAARAVSATAHLRGNTGDLRCRGSSRSPGSRVAARRCQSDSWSHPRPRDLVGARSCQRVACSAGSVTVVITSPPSRPTRNAALPELSAQAPAADCCGYRRQSIPSGSNPQGEEWQAGAPAASRSPG